MRNKIWLAVLSLILGVSAYIYLFNADYDLRLVPNKPDLRPNLPAPSPQENNPQFQLAGGSERETRGFPKREIVDLVSKFPGLFFREATGKERRIALTFDDGPDSVYTPQILDILKENNVKATFFLIGNRVKLFPEVVKRMVDEGHIVGNHTLNHPNIIKLKPEEVEKEVLEGEAAMAAITGYRTALFRSPYGSIDPQRIEQIRDLQYKIIAWNVDSLDWMSLTAEQVKRNILENITIGDIILQHSSGSKEENLSGTVGALREIIQVMKKDGYTFVTIPELLNIPYQKQ